MIKAARNVQTNIYMQLHTEYSNRWLDREHLVTNLDFCVRDGFSKKLIM